MNEQPASAGESLLVDLLAVAPGRVRPLDAEHSTRFEAALEAPGTRRAYGSTPATWGRRAGGSCRQAAPVLRENGR